MANQNDLPEWWQRLIGGAGQMIRLGRGVLGKTATIAVVAILVLAFIAWRISGNVPLMFIGGAVVLIALAYLGLAFAFAFKYPGPALLEGGELLQWQQQAAAMVMPPYIDNRLGPDPLALPHQAGAEEPIAEPVVEPEPSEAGGDV